MENTSLEVSSSGTVDENEEAFRARLSDFVSLTFSLSGASHIASHNIYIWDRGAGALDKILEGPREPLIDVDWHPSRPLLASVSTSGNINIWFTPTKENWSAYAPGFEELEENVEYEEREDEFDLVS